ncbi:MAG: dihydrolipoyl dehydrogenase family protein, partial [Sciscionella sp.]
MDNFDVVVVGGGPVGENVAGRVVQGGLSAVLVESERYGGECSYWACMPSKALLRPGQVLSQARRMPGVEVADRLDAEAVLRRRNSFTSDWDDSGQVDWARGAGIALARGRGRITGPREVTVDGPDGERVLTASRAVVVCTGSVPVRPTIDGIDRVEVWGTRQATSAQRVPRRLAVLGGGVAGVELAQAWSSLGSEVTLVAAGERLLDRFEDIAGELVRDGLRANGVTVRLGATAQRVSRNDAGVELTVSTGERVVADEFLVATGRRPASDDIGVDTVGLKPEDALHVDDSGVVEAVDGGWLYAAGDVTARAPVTHQGKYEGRVVADVIVASARGEQVDAAPWSRYAATADHGCVPQVVFTDPEVASVGRTSMQARRERIANRVVDLDIAVAGSALHSDGYTGRVRMVVD